MTDGYGDYVRHYLRAMASYPQLAPAGNHLLRTSSVIKNIVYGSQNIEYTAFDGDGKELLKLQAKPASIKGADEWVWKELTDGGVLTILRKNMNHIIIIF